ncbi:hypothetical protein OGAPHI_005650 [Ogataea philodendri]|uniref:Uncharacterized protein n=1 Tax=Ogataea philodendri TaxID=1378263 RepID=A0A9P8NYT0_9ASCO|nr:uncharacterized protein OGAPHI_005650 [Ogataea philodendri]KAH3662398.1 hypothetical protein OGAPHI_005650 [Ogataea philodendri]
MVARLRNHELKFAYILMVDSSLGSTLVSCGRYFNVNALFLMNLATSSRFVTMKKLYLVNTDHDLSLNERMLCFLEYASTPSNSDLWLIWPETPSSSNVMSIFLGLDKGRLLSWLTRLDAMAVESQPLVMSSV